ncbi:MAG: sulfotransferase family protein [Solirubrobacterales bacterium]
MSQEPGPLQSPEGPAPLGTGARPDRVIAVLGMHRSGTSALVGSLQRNGLFLGAHNRVNKYNPRGNRENRPVVRLNEEILRHSGGSWDSPPSVVEWAAAHFEQAREILGEYSGRPLWGFKDPRTLLTHDGWQALVPDLEFVGVFRHPARVARSLASRPELPVADPLAVWRAYNAHLLELHRRRPFPVLSFDDDTELLERNLDRVAGMLGLTAHPDEEPFFSDELRRLDSEPTELPAEVTALYEELRSVAL